MLAGDVAGAWSVVETALVSGAMPAEIHLHMLVPALRTIGQRWADGDVTVAAEHRATVTAQRLIGQLGPHFARRGRTRGNVLIGAPAGELHALPSAILADLLRDARYGVIDLGANTPSQSFVDAASRAQRLLAVCIGVSNPGLDPAIADTVRVLRAAEIVAPVLLGGGAIDDEQHARRLGASAWSGHDATTMIGTLAGL
jgi:methanogenic corrinoid protein MtbC1